MRIVISPEGAYLGSKYAIPEIIKNGGGLIINAASIYGIVGGPNRAVYAASKERGVEVPLHIVDGPEIRGHVAGLQGAIRSLELAVGRILNALSDAGLD